MSGPGPLLDSILPGESGRFLPAELTLGAWFYLVWTQTSDKPRLGTKRI